jgi:hypothetical protein
VKNVFIDNMTEDVWPFVSAIADTKARQAEIMENVALSERHYLGALAQFPQSLTYIAPKPIDPQFADYVHTLLQVEAPQVLYPQHHKGQLSREIGEDSTLMKSIPRSFRLHSYCASQELLELVQTLSGQGYEIESPELPLSIDSFKQTVNVYGTKCGLRQALTQVEHPEFVRMAPGMVCDDFETAVLQAAFLASTEGGVVVKTNKGHAGMGVVIFDPAWVNSHLTSLQEDIRSRLSLDNGYWEKFPITVEQYIQPDLSIGGGFPNIEAKVTESGYLPLFYCGMRVVHGVFSGVEVGKGVDLPGAVHHIGKWLGDHYYSLGYRGYFDIDFVSGLDGIMYMSESNMRRTGGTWAFYLAKRLLGASFFKTHYVATQLVEFSGSFDSFGSFLSHMKPLLYNPDSSEGVVFYSSQLLKQGKLGYLVIGRDKERARKIEDEMKAWL